MGFGGDDMLRGGGDADLLTGGAGADVFVFDAIADSRLGASDRITDFNRAQGDRIDLSAIDVAGDRAFTFIGDGMYSGVAGELRVAAASDALIVYADVDGDGRSDMSIVVYGVTSLTSADFIL
jgi:Ca2+-binding RTX toxin-like protein